MKRYNEALVRDLEAKVQQLERANRELERKVAVCQAAEAALRDSEERNEVLLGSLSSAGIGLFVVDRDYRVRQMNEVMVRWFGNQTGRTCYLSVGRRDSPCPYCKLQDVLDEGTTVHYQPTAADGRTLDIVATPIRNGDGSVSKMEIVTDISVSKRTEAALSASQALNLSLVEHLPHNIFVKDRDSVYLSCNKHYAQVLGTAPEDVAGKDDFAFHPPKLAQKYRDDDQAVMADGALKDIEETIEVAGEERWVHTVKVPFRDREGQVIGVVGIFEDVTERRLADKALRESEAHLRRFYESGLLGVIYWNMDGEITDANDKFLEMVGYTRGDLTAGRLGWADMTPPEYQYLDERAMTELQATGVNRMPFEKVYIRKDGSHIPITLAGAMLDDARFNGVAFILDITDRKRVETALVESTERLKRTLDAAVVALGATTELRDPYTAGHQRRVAELACAIAAELDWEEGQIATLRTAALLHDIGKIVVPAEILAKPGRLSHFEMQLVRHHASAGADTVAGIDFEGAIAEIIHQHHERLDGSGYPDGLRDGQINHEARVLAVADVVEAMISHRPYRPAFRLEEALAEIEDGAERCYDAKVCAACVKLFRERGFALLL